MNNEITLKPIRSYEVFFEGKKLGEFKVESEWNGLIKLQGERGVIIASREDELNVLDRILNLDINETVKLVRVSKEISDKIKASHVLNSETPV